MTNKQKYYTVLAASNVLGAIIGTALGRIIVYWITGQ